MKKTTPVARSQTRPPLLEKLKWFVVRPMHDAVDAYTGAAVLLVTGGFIKTQREER